MSECQNGSCLLGLGAHSDREQCSVEVLHTSTLSDTVLLYTTKIICTYNTYIYTTHTSYINIHTFY